MSHVPTVLIGYIVIQIILIVIQTIVRITKRLNQTRMHKRKKGCTKRMKEIGDFQQQVNHVLERADVGKHYAYYEGFELMPRELDYLHEKGLELLQYHYDGSFFNFGTNYFYLFKKTKRLSGGTE